MERESGSGGPRGFGAFVVVAVLCLIWGSTWLVIRGGLQDLPPLTSAGVRFLLAGGCMTLIAPKLARLEGGAAPSMRLSLALGVPNIAICYGLIYWCETIIPSGLVSLLWAVYPLMMAVLGHFFLPGEQLAPRNGFGFLLGFLGVVLLFGTDLKDIGRGAVPAGALLLVSPLAVAFGTLYIKRHGEGVSSVLLNKNGMLVGAVCLLAAAFVFERDEEITWSRDAILSVAYLTLVGTVLAFSLYYWVLRSARVHLLSLIAYVTPVIALTLGATLAEESVGTATVVGGALVLVGVAFVVRRR